MLTMAEAMKKWFRVETKSHIMPYIVRDHAWSDEELDAMNQPRYCNQSPDGYNRNIDCQPYTEPSNGTHTNNANASSSAAANSSASSSSDSNSTAADEGSEVEKEAWDALLINRTWQFGLKPSKINETIRFREDASFKLNASGIEGEWIVSLDNN